MDTLRSTMVASAFRPADEPSRTLLDFIDESSVETLRSSLKQTIDSAQTSRSSFLSSLKAFDHDRQSLKAAIASAPSPSRTRDSPIPPLLHSLSTHAAEMAVLLDSLTSHFDLCANAVKHTEGGFLALKDAVAHNRLPDGVTMSGVIASPDASHQLPPLSEAERLEMLQVLLGDAREVPAVVQDLELRLLEMEQIAPQIAAYVAEQRGAYAGTTAAFGVLEGIAARLPGYVGASARFGDEWQGERTRLEEQARELDDMRVFYEGYHASYDGLIVEVARRRAAEEKMKGILRKALEQVQRVHDADTREREGFRREVGEFLPSDLWPGLVADAPRWEVGVFGEEGEEGGESTPELERVVVEEAVRREKERGVRGIS
jgi:autophagy-related protein 17